MIQEVDAVFRNGVFVPKESYSLPEGTQVHLVVESPGWEPPQLEDPSDRQAALREMIERIQQASVAPEAFPISRDALHERR